MALLSAITIAGCTTVDGGGDSSPGGGGGGGVASSSTSDAAVKEMWGGKTLKVGFSPPILSEFYTQIEQSAFNRMKEYEQRYGIKWSWERQGALNDAHSGTSMRSSSAPRPARTPCSRSTRPARTREWTSTSSTRPKS
jgi:hypothetical protein